jgi:hypothetical protein
MKKLSLVAACIFLMQLLAQAQPANTDNISTMRIGIFKLKSTVQELEKLLGQKIQVRHKEDAYMDTAKLMYNQANYILSFVKRYKEKETDADVMELRAVSSANTKLKTKSNIGIGSTKTAILAAYDKLDMKIYNDWEYKTKGNVKDKIQFITVRDADSGTDIIFTTEDRMVKSIEVTFYEGD